MLKHKICSKLQQRTFLLPHTTSSRSLLFPGFSQREWKIALMEKACSHVALFDGNSVGLYN